MEHRAERKFSTEALKTFAVLSLGLSGCTPPSEISRISPAPKEPAVVLPPIEFPRIRSKQEYLEKIDRSWVMREARALTPEELAEEGLIPEELPALLEELRYSFDESLDGDVVVSFPGVLFEQGVVMRYKNGDLPKEKGERALNELKKGLQRGVDGASIPFLVTQDDEQANTFFTFIASPSILPASPHFISSKPSSLQAYSVPSKVDLCRNAYGTFELIKQSVITMRTQVPDQFITDLKNAEGIPERMKPKIVEEVSFFSVFAVSDHELIGHPAGYPSSNEFTGDNHSR
ncbi:MAG: hypothetical protein AAB855_02775, partial [Patescibacteria group bacterium]